MILTAPIAAPGLAAAARPSAVRVRSFGHFSVWLDGKSLPLAAKAPKKPLELLRALVALGAQEVPTAAIEDALWPDLDGAAAHNAFNVALHRLRKLLGDKQALVLREGRLSLNGSRVWTDVAAFEHAIDEEHADPVPQIEHVFDLYRGHFLADEEAPWAHAPRERLRSRLLRLCGRLGQVLEDQAHWSDAVALYRRVTEVEPVAETCHRGLIRCLRQLGHAAEALDAYRRYGEMLSLNLGVKPSAQTHALVHELLGDQRSPA